jgi:beta-lactamase superfamily II metal-dependent hydrolase
MKKLVSLLVLSLVMSIPALGVSAAPQAAAASDNEVTAYYLQVDGDATLLRLTTSGRTYWILVDTGKNATTIDQIKPLMGSNKRFEYIFITHAHADHAGGLYHLFNNGYTVENLVYNDVEGGTLDATEDKAKDPTDTNKLTKDKKVAWRKIVDNIATKYRKAEKIAYTYRVQKYSSKVTFYKKRAKNTSLGGPNVKPYTFWIGTYFTMTIFPALKQYEKTNDCSMIVKIKSTAPGHKASWVFMGDILNTSLTPLLANKKYAKALESAANETTYLKMPHHTQGRYTCTSKCDPKKYKGKTPTYTYVGYLHTSNKAAKKQFAKLNLRNNSSSLAYYLQATGVETYKTPTGKKVQVNTYSLYKTKSRNTKALATKIINRAERLIAWFRAGAGSKVIGVGNVKSDGDAMAFFNMVGMAEYHDVRPGCKVAGPWAQYLAAEGNRAGSLLKAAKIGSKTTSIMPRPICGAYRPVV